MTDVTFPSQPQPAQMMEEMDCADGHRGISNSCNTSYVIGNYDLVRSEVDKFKKSMEDSYDSLGMLSLELDTNKMALSSDDPDDRAGKAAVYFSNRIQDIGFHLISNVVRTLHQTQAGVLHRYPELKGLLQQCITYGPVPNICCVDKFDEKDQNQTPADECSEKTSVPNSNTNSIQPLETTLNETPDIQEHEADAAPVDVLQEDNSADSSSNIEISDPALEEIEAPPTSSIEEPIQEETEATVEEQTEATPSSKIEGPEDCDVEVPTTTCRPLTLCSEHVTNSVNLKPLSPLSTADILECLSVDEECLNSDFASEPVMCSPRIPSQSQPLPKTVISVVDNSNISLRPGRQTITEDDPVEMDTRDPSPTPTPTPPNKKQTKVRKRKRGGRGGRRGDGTISKRKKQCDREGGNHMRPVNARNRFRGVSDDEMHNGSHPPPVPPPPPTGNGNAQDGDEFEDPRELYDMEATYPNIFKSIVVLQPLKPDELDLLKRNNLSVFVSNTGKLLAERDSGVEEVPESTLTVAGPSSSSVIAELSSASLIARPSSVIVGPSSASVIAGPSSSSVIAGHSSTSLIAGPTSATVKASSPIAEPSAIVDPISNIPSASGEMEEPSTELQGLSTEEAAPQQQQRKRRKRGYLMEEDPLQWLLKNLTQFVNSLDRPKGISKKRKRVKLAVDKEKKTVKVERKPQEKEETVDDWLLADSDCDVDDGDDWVEGDNAEGLMEEVPVPAEPETPTSVTPVVSVPLPSTAEVEVPVEPTAPLPLIAVPPPVTPTQPGSMSHCAVLEDDSFDSDQSDLEEVECDDSPRKIRISPAKDEDQPQPSSTELMKPPAPKPIVASSAEPHPKIVNTPRVSTSSSESDSEEKISKRKVLSKSKPTKNGAPPLPTNEETVPAAEVAEGATAMDSEKSDEEKTTNSESVAQVEITPAQDNANEEEIITNAVPVDANEEIVVNTVSVGLNEGENVPVPTTATFNEGEVVANPIPADAEETQEVATGVVAEKNTTEEGGNVADNNVDRNGGKAEESDDDCVVVHSVKSTRGQPIMLETGGLSAVAFRHKQELEQEAAAKAAADAKRAKRRAPAPSTSSVSFLGFYTGERTGRKDIRPIKQEKTAETYQAEKQEIARLKALEESQKLQEELAIEERPRGIVLEFDLETKKPLISVEKTLSDKLHPHQEDGVRFIWSSCFGTVNNLTESGCILAHLMGLGKSLTTLALIHTVISHPEILNLRSALVLCPLGVVSNWKKECERWLTETEFKIPVFMLYGKKGMNIEIVREWENRGGIALLHYNAAASCINGKSDDTEETEEASEVVEGVEESQRRIMKEILLKCDILVCDEGHQLKTPGTSFNKAVNSFNTKRRIILTGTPLQNNLKEYYNMINLIKPNLLGSPSEFANKFENPIKNGLHTDSLEEDVRLMKYRTFALNDSLRGYVQRKNYDVLTQFLKPKHEYALFVPLMDLQNRLYKTYHELHCVDHGEGRKNQKLWTHYHILQKISTHPKLLYSTEYNEKKTNRECKAKVRVLDHEEEEEEVAEVANEAEEEDPSIDPTWYEKIIPASSRHIVSNEWGQSGKLILLKEIIRASHERGDKLLIFSKFTYTLNVIEEFIQKYCDGRWELGESYFRIDGSIHTKKRDQFCEEFNSSESARVFLLTTKSGGLGINLRGANRVVLFDVSMNPTDDCQSVFRVYRLGQEKECFVYRLVSEGGMEETTFKRSVLKLGLAKRVVDERQVDRHYVMNESNDMYRFTPSSDSRPHSKQPIPSDVMLQKLLQSHPDFISHYVEQDSLLEGEGDLNEEEKTYARAEVISKPAAVVQRKSTEKKQPGPVKPAPVPAPPPPLPKYSVPSFAGFVSVEQVATAVYHSLTEFNPSFTPKENYDIAASMKDTFEHIISIIISLRDKSISSLHRQNLKNRLHAAYEEVSIIVGREAARLAAKKVALLAAKNSKISKPKSTERKPRGRSRKVNSKLSKVKVASTTGAAEDAGPAAAAAVPNGSASTGTPMPDSGWIETGSGKAGARRTEAAAVQDGTAGSSNVTQQQLMPATGKGKSGSKRKRKSRAGSRNSK